MRFVGMDVHLHTGLVADPVFKDHTTGPDHPECPDRYDAAYLALARAGLLDQLQKIPCRFAVDAELLLAHTPGYLALITREIESGASWLSTGDTPVMARSLDVARYAVGGVLNAVKATCEGKVKNAFCLVRPPGHHATADRGMGFCLLNNIAIAARYAKARLGLSRVAVLDWDVHHGNGTQDIFYEDASVFYCSVHQAPWYPGTGAASETGRGPGRGTTLNIPLPAGAGRADVFQALEHRLIPALARFAPELILVSAGFDSRAGDPLGGWQLADEDFADMTSMLLLFAEKHAGGRLVSVLEGGYDLGGLASAVTAHVRALIG